MSKRIDVSDFGKSNAHCWSVIHLIEHGFVPVSHFFHSIHQFNVSERQTLTTTRCEFHARCQTEMNECMTFTFKWRFKTFESI